MEGQKYSYIIEEDREGMRLDRFLAGELTEQSRSYIQKLIRESVSFKDIWIYLLESAMRYKIYRENGFLVENATERYIHFKKLFPDLSERIPQRHIATYLGIAPESLSRIRSAMKESL